MGAFTVSSMKEKFAVGLNGGKILTGLLAGPASYDAGGSVIDLSSYLNGAVGPVVVVAEGAVDYECQYVPAGSRATATGKIYVHEAGTQATGDLSGVVFSILVEGTD
jgi:hypothetical protein